MIFEGILDEDVQQSTLINAFAKLKASGLTPPLVLDFSKVEYANSAGILTWVKFLREINVACRYVNAPIWLIHQMNMIDDFLKNGSTVYSFQAPYFCPETQESKSLLLVVGKDIPVQKDYAGFAAPNRSEGGKVYECDFIPERYLSFISGNYEQFSK